MEALPTAALYSGPTLFLVGALSDYVTPEDHALIYTHFPTAILRSIPQAGHWLHAENPVAFAAEVADFLGTG